MLSILQRQAKILEKELKDKQNECLALRQGERELQAVVEAKSCRIDVLEADLAALRQQLAAELHEPSLDAASAATAPAPPKEAVLTEGELGSLQSSLSDLAAKLSSCEGKLTIAELRASMIGLEKATQALSHRGHVHRLEASLEAVRGDLARARKAQAGADGLALQLAQASSDLGRRDEQLAFLMEVHDASSSYDWTGGANRVPSSEALWENEAVPCAASIGGLTTATATTPTVFAAGSAGNAVAALSRLSPTQRSPQAARHTSVSPALATLPSIMPSTAAAATTSPALHSGGSGGRGGGSSSGGVHGSLSGGGSDWAGPLLEPLSEGLGVSVLGGTGFGVGDFGVDLVAALGELGVDAATAAAALAASGGDLDQAVLSLFPAKD